MNNFSVVESDGFKLVIYPNPVILQGIFKGRNSKQFVIYIGRFRIPRLSPPHYVMRKRAMIHNEIYCHSLLLKLLALGDALSKMHYTHQHRLAVD